MEGSEIKLDPSEQIMEAALEAPNCAKTLCTYCFWPVLVPKPYVRNVSGIFLSQNLLYVMFRTCDDTKTFCT